MLIGFAALRAPRVKSSHGTFGSAEAYLPVRPPVERGQGAQRVRSPTALWERSSQNINIAVKVEGGRSGAVRCSSWRVPQVVQTGDMETAAVRRP